MINNISEEERLLFIQDKIGKYKNKWWFKFFSRFVK